MMGWFRSTLHKWSKPRVQALEEDVREEADSIERDLLTKELDVIERQHRLNAQRGKYEFLASWMAARAGQVPRSSSDHGIAIGSGDEARKWFSRTSVVRGEASTTDGDNRPDRSTGGRSVEGN